MEKEISGWARNKFFKCNIRKPKSLVQLKTQIKQKSIIRGLGRSYGDSSIQRKNIISTENLKKILNFDKKKKIIEVEAGISINDLLVEILPKNLFLPVTPGSKYISIGGMVASDVHGKNHHETGSFRNFIISLKIIDENGNLLSCSKTKNKDLFNYTIGGMGLTGIIYSCKFKLIQISSDKILQQKIKTYNLRDTLTELQNNSNWQYNVGWIDTSIIGENLGRSIIFKGNHYKTKNIKKLKFKDNNFIEIKNKFPTWFINKFLIKILNSLYFFVNLNSKNIVNLENYFYQLDKIKNWNLIYGKKGFISYQLIIPENKAYSGIKKILEILYLNKCYSFVSVIKFLGKTDGYNSFGIKGYTLVFDFPIYKNIHPTLKKITKIIIKLNGKIYLCKDSIINSKDFKNMQTGFNDIRFKKIRKIKKKYFESEQSNRLNI